MKKLLIVHNFYRNYGGEDSNIYEEIKFLENDYRVEFFNAKNEDKFSLFSILGLITRSNYKKNRDFKKVLKGFEPNVVYIHNTWFTINLGIFKILQKHNIKVILKIHNFRYDCARYFFAKSHLKGKKRCDACGFEVKKGIIVNKYFESSYVKSLLLYFYSLKYFRILQNFPIKIIAINNFHKLQLIKLGIAKNKIAVINNPLNLEIYQSTNKKNNIIYAGRLSREKGLIELLEAWVAINMDDYTLLIIGEGELKKELMAKYTQKNIKFLGFLQNEKVIEYISNSTAVVTATKLYEGQPRLLSEASALGTLSIYPSFGGMDEFFPVDYSFSFEQFNYDDLKNKLLLLRNNKIKEISSKKVIHHTQNLLNPEGIRTKFSSVIQESL
jgi:glycosyltransferase involved in cell wall biosynthesis